MYNSFLTNAGENTALNIIIAVIVVVVLAAIVFFSYIFPLIRRIKSKNKDKADNCGCNCCKK